MNRVYITGLGCVTPLGNNIEALWEGLINGRCGIAPIAAPHSDTLPIHVAAEVKDFNPEEFGLDKGTVPASLSIRANQEYKRSIIGTSGDTPYLPQSIVTFQYIYLLRLIIHRCRSDHCCLQYLLYLLVLYLPVGIRTNREALS